MIRMQNSRLQNKRGAECNSLPIFFFFSENFPETAC